MDTYNNMEAKRITINQAKKVLENINTYVHVGKFETGLRTNLKRVKSISYHLVCRHKDHPFFKQFYHGPKGIYIDSPRYKEIEALEKPIWNTPIYKLLDLTITKTPLDGRTRYAKQLPVFNADILAELTY